MKGKKEKKKELYRNFREAVQFYLIDSKTFIGKLVDIAIILLNFLICGIFVIETYNISDHTRTILWNIEVITVIFLIIEYIARLYGAPNRIKQLYNIYGIIDLIAILPTIIFFIPFISLDINYIRLIRVFRVFRIFRFIRFAETPDFFFGTITFEFLKVLRLALGILIIFFVSSGLFYIVESPVNENVKNFGNAFYFTVVAITTVGFGDIIPVSEAGRWVVVLMIISGIIFIPYEASQILKGWVNIKKKKSTCPRCGLMYHDRDASHCKSCGHVIYQEYEGD